MSTNAYICYKTEDGNIKGVYNHWDGYLEELGHDIIDVAIKQFIDNRGEPGVRNNATVEEALQAFIQVYIKGHPGGWSTFPTKCYCHSPEFILRDGYHEAVCEGDDCFEVEFTYLILPKEGIMEVYNYDTKIEVFDFNTKEFL